MASGPRCPGGTSGSERRKIKDACDVREVMWLSDVCGLVFGCLLAFLQCWVLARRLFLAHGEGSESPEKMDHYQLTLSSRNTCGRSFNRINGDRTASFQETCNRSVATGHEIQVANGDGNDSFFINLPPPLILSAG